MSKSFGDQILDGEEGWSLDFLLSDKFAKFLELIPEAVILSAKNGQVLYVNDQAEKLFRYSRAEFLKLKIENLVPERFRAAHPEKRAFFFDHPTPRFLDDRHYDLFARRKDGSEFPMEPALFRLQTDQGDVAVNILQDVTEAKSSRQAIEQRNKELSKLAGTDLLTGLPNRRYFEEELARLLAESRRYQHGLALLFIDLDRFKLINDELGHYVGDELLHAVAQQMRDEIREEDFLARFGGGGEFVAIVHPIENLEEAEVVAKRLVAVGQKVFHIAGHDLRVGASVGIARYDGKQSIKELLQLADMAMYQAKARGGSRFYLSG